MEDAILNLKLVATPGLPHLMGVDRFWRCYYNPEMVAAAKISDAELGGVLIHEACHLLRDHAGRAIDMGINAGNHHIWNIADDMEINDDLVKAKVPLPEPWLPSAMGFDNDLLAEVYYKQLLEKATTVTIIVGTKGQGDGKGDSGQDKSDQSGEGSGKGKGDGGKEGTWKGTDGSKISKIWADIDDGASDGMDREHHKDVDDRQFPGLDKVTAEAIRQAVAKRIRESGRGDIPAGMKRWADNQVAGKTIPWHRLLPALMRNVIVTAGRGLSTFSRPYRRQYLHPHEIYPGQQSVRPRVFVQLDSSGSMSEEQLGIALNVVASTLRRLTAEVDVTTVDADNGVVQRCFNAKRVNITGGGGTDMRVGLALAAKRRPAPSLVLTITDGDTPWPDTYNLPHITVLISGAKEADIVGKAPKFGRYVVVTP